MEPRHSFSTGGLNRKLVHLEHTWRRFIKRNDTPTSSPLVAEACHSVKQIEILCSDLFVVNKSTKLSLSSRRWATFIETISQYLGGHTRCSSRIKAKVSPDKSVAWRLSLVNQSLKWYQGSVVKKKGVEETLGQWRCGSSGVMMENLFISSHISIFNISWKYGICLLCQQVLCMRFCDTVQSKELLKDKICAVKLFPN